MYGYRLAAFSLLLALAACGGGDPDQATEQQSGRKQALAVTPQAPTFSATWTQIPNPNYAPPAGPYGRTWTEMTWDSLRQRMTVFGGNGAPSGYGNDIWSFDTATSQWTVVEPFEFCPGNTGFTKPNGTDDSNFKYDPVNDLFWVFGAASGYRCLSYTTPRTAAAGSGPGLVVDPSLPTGAVDHYRNFHVRTASADVLVSAYDPATSTLTLATPIAGFGPGSSYAVYATTGAGIWYFNPNTHVWVGQDTPSGNTGPTPGGRIAPAVAYSDPDKKFALFAGKALGVDKQVWTLDVTTKQWTQLPLPATTPPHLREMLNSFVYDKQNDVFILFGGVCSSDPTCPDGTRNGKTWVYRLSTNTWTDMNPPVAPSARAQQVMSYDEQNGVVVLFGGGTDQGATNDTWVYHYPSNTWTQLNTATAPSARWLSQITYDPVNKQTLLFGGQTSGSIAVDVWSLKLVPTGEAAPSVALTAPTAGSTYTAPASVTLSANAADADGNIAKVEFFAGATKLGEVTSAPYTLQWNGVAAGSYSLTARATDNAGLTTTSSAVNITVNPPANQAPSAAITAPAAGSTYTAPAAFTITAAAADSDGSVAKVEFFDGATKLGETTSAPYSLNVSGLAAGSHSLTVRATDNLGLATTSSAVIITVNSPANQPPTVSLTAPVAGTTYTAPAAITLTASAADADGSVAKVEYFAGASKLGETTSAPHSFTWTNVAAGSYSLTARATDNAGATTTSSAVAVTVNDPSGGNPINVALQANGGVASASSTYSAAYPVASVNNGVRTAANWGNGGGWNDASASTFPDWVQVTFNGTKSINRIDVFTLADNYAAGTQPTQSTTFSQYGITAFEVQYWTGSAWATVPGGSITGNNLVWRSVSFPTVSTDRIRVLVNNGLYWYARIVEIEAWTP